MQLLQCSVTICYLKLLSSYSGLDGLERWCYSMLRCFCLVQIVKGGVYKGLNTPQKPLVHMLVSLQLQFGEIKHKQSKLDD